jgi:hypothetical protein
LTTGTIFPNNDFCEFSTLFMRVLNNEEA